MALMVSEILCVSDSAYIWFFYGVLKDAVKSEGIYRHCNDGNKLGQTRQVIFMAEWNPL